MAVSYTRTEVEKALEEADLKYAENEAAYRRIKREFEEAQFNRHAMQAPLTLTCEMWDAVIAELQFLRDQLTMLQHQAATDATRSRIAEGQI